MRDRAYGHYTDDVVMSLEFDTHMVKMTLEGLNLKSEIAAELAWRDQQIAKLEAKVAELDRLNTDLAMESHALQGRMAELEALVRDIDYGKTPDCACWMLQTITRTESEWMEDAMRLCPPAPQEDA